MTEKHKWISDNLSLIEETTGIKLYGTVCTDITFIAKQLNDANETILRLEKENEQLASELVECKALIMMLSDTTVSGRVDNLIYSRYNFYSEDEYYEKLEEYKNKVIKEL